MAWRVQVDRGVAHDDNDGRTCPHCGLRYRDMRTGFDYKTVRDMLNPTTSPRGHIAKRRAAVLGYWFQLKQKQWRDHLEYCEHYASLNNV